MSEALLKVENVTVSFEGFKALDDLSFSLMPGTVRVLIGPNGAGKSTLLDTVIGRVRPTNGRITYKGEDLTSLPEYEIVRKGICRKFQAPGVLETLTIEENIAVAARRDHRWWRALTRKLSASERVRVDEILEITSLKDKRGKQAARLAHGEKQWLEIGMVVASDAELLLLDEPAAGMTHHEREQTARLIRELAGDHAFVVIDHDIGFVEQLAAPVSVLHMGRMLTEGTVDEVRRDPQVAAAYLGRVDNGEIAYA